MKLYAWIRGRREWREYYRRGFRVCRSLPNRFRDAVLLEKG